MFFTLVCPSSLPTEWAAGVPANDGFDRAKILSRLEALRGEGHDFTVIDTASLSEADRDSLYVQAATTQKRVRRIYGSRSEAGLNFGRHLPSLLVSQSVGQHPDDVYPQEGADGRFITIADYFKGERA